VTELPRGTVTLVFTDIEGSTRLLQELGDDYADLLERHRELIRVAVARHGGVEVDAVGESFLLAFGRADDAVAAAVDAQRALSEFEVRVRMGIHTGQPRHGGSGYVGLDVHRTARICDAAHGGQILVSQTTRDLIESETRDLGDHRLKDLSQAQRLYQLLAPGLAHDFPPPRTLENRPTNLPSLPTPLIGREREIHDTTELLRRSDVRLLTLTGAGGCGKTRLALQSAAELVEDYADGVFFVALEAVEDPGLVLPTIAQTLGVNETGAQTLTRALTDFLGDRRLLLVVDNFEQLLDAGPTLVELLAPTAVELLVTSRAPLRLSGEHEYEVPPLDLPDLRSLPDAAAVSQYESVALFVERAHAVRSDFAVTAENAPAIAEICSRLDGLPLAIELAAARVRLLTPQAMLDRLGERLALLTSGPRDLPTRQQTLRGAIDWSYDLLGEDERRLFARLGVFAGGCRLEAAEQVCKARLDELETLLENNLIRQEERPDGEPRFFMLETIREYALERLRESGRDAEVRGAHARYYVQWAEARFADRRQALLFGQYQLEDEESENFRAALTWLRDEGDVDLELRLAVALRWYWGASGYLSEGRRWLHEALETANGASALIRARGKLAEAALAWRQGDIEGTRGLCEKAIPAFERHDDRAHLAECLQLLGIAAELRGDLAAQARAYERAEPIYRELGYEAALLAILNNRGYTALLLGDYERGEAILRECLERSQTQGTPLGYHLLNLGLAHIRLGRLEEARIEFREALDEGSRDNVRDLVFYALEGLANVHAAARDDLPAARLWGASEAIREATGAKLARAEFELHEEAVQAARERAGDAFDRSWAEGRALSEERAVALGLDL
jgi:predicted ATPase/class 3 adenylate cyclase